MSVQKWMVLIIAIICLPSIVDAQRFEQMTMKYYAKSSQVLMSEGRVDSQLVVDPVSGDEILKTRMQRDVLPVSVNGKKVYAANEVTTMPQYLGKTSLEEYLIVKLKNDIEKERMQDGILHINPGRAVIDEKGKMAYYEYDGGRWQTKEGVKLDHHISDRFGTAILFALKDAPPMKPATLNDENVCVYINLSKCDYHFDIKDHKVTYKKD